MHRFRKPFSSFFEAGLGEKGHEFILTVNPNDFIPYMKMERIF
jgi:hypothetical protein